MSMVFCFTFSYGIGIYWIAGSVIRSIQQIIVNKWIDKMDINELIKACSEYEKTTNRRITFEYSLFAGVNDTKECAAELHKLLRGTNN